MLRGLQHAQPARQSSAPEYAWYLQGQWCCSTVLFQLIRKSQRTFDPNATSADPHETLLLSKIAFRASSRRHQAAMQADPPAWTTELDA